MSLHNKATQVEHIFKKYALDTEMCGEFLEEDIIHAEVNLNLWIPEDYKWFLKKYGSGVFHSMELYGMVRDMSQKMIPNAIWVTQYMRINRNLPNSYIVVAFDGWEQYYCIDTAFRDNLGISPVVKFPNRINDGTELTEFVADSYIDFLLIQLKEEIDIMLDIGTIF